MLTLDKYFIKSIFSPLIIISFVLTCVIWITQVMRRIDLLETGISGLDFFKVCSLMIPSLIFYISPVITLIAVIVVYSKFKEEQQILILQSSGLSNFSISKPALYIGMLMTIVSFSISAYWMPLCCGLMKDRIDYMRAHYVSTTLTPNRFNQISSDLTLYVKHADQLGNMSGIVLFDNSNTDSRTVVFAKYGKIYIQDELIDFQLYDGARYAYDVHSNLTRLNFDSLKIEIDVSNDDTEERSRSQSELFINEMLFPDQDLPMYKQMAFIIDGHGRLVWPLFNLVFVFVFLSLFLRYPFVRKVYWGRVFISIAPLVLIILIHFSLQKLSHENINLIFLLYFNVFAWIMFATWKCFRCDVSA